MSDTQDPRPDSASDNPADGEDFAAVLAAFEQEQAAPTRAPKPGEMVTGRVISIGQDAVFVDLGAKSEGMIRLVELLDDEGQPRVAVGDSVEAMVSGQDAESGCLLLRVQAGHGTADYGELRQAQEHGIPVEGRVKAVNKGGVEVEVAGLRAFCPISQLSDSFVEDANTFLGQKLAFRITRFEESAGRRPNLVLSRRALLQEEARERAAEARDRLTVGSTVRGKVTSVTSYGAFVDLGGVEGLLHVSEISHQRVEDPKELLTVGQVLDVQVLKIEVAPAGEPDKEKGKAKGDRISLSRKSLEKDPWQEAVTRFPPGTVLKGRVVRIQPFGAFVEIAPGLDGLVHVSEMSADSHVTHPREVVDSGQSVEVKVLKVDPAERRISLSMAAASATEEGGNYSSEGRSGDSGSPGGPGAGLGSMAHFFEKARRPKK